MLDLGEETVGKLASGSTFTGASLVAQMVKSPPAMQETWAWSLDWEDPWEKKIVVHSKYSCLENPMDKGTWRATVHGVVKLDTTEQLTLHSQTYGQVGELIYMSV